MSELNGAQALVRTLVDCGVEVCFGNPGTSEMHFVAALDAWPEMRGVLCLFEGVATGAADGYGRMTDRPAATLLHLGPGLGNGIANLHNARRAGTPVLNIVGDHATYHKQLDAPLESDVDALAATVSSWLHRSTAPADIGADAAAAVASALWSAAGGDGSVGPRWTGTSGSVATLILPADVSWEEGGKPADPLPHPAGRAPSVEDLGTATTVLEAGRATVLLLGGRALREEGLRAASRIEQATGVRVLAELWPARKRQGEGVPAFRPLAHRAEDVGVQLAGAEHLVLAGAREPVSWFAYPGRASELTPPGARIHRLAGHANVDVVETLTRLADLVAPGVEPVVSPPAPRGLPAGPLTSENWAWVVAALLPEDAIISDESITAGLPALDAALAGAPAHDVLGLTGLAIGQGIPLAVGAAIACPGRPVICLEADGSAMYTISALWTQAREQLDVTTVVLNNRSYAILRAELARVGAAAAGSAAARFIDLSRPDLDFVSLATGMGVPATRATTTEQLAEQFTAAVYEPGPHLIEAVLDAK